jgi:hypothetical protein
MKLRAYTFLVSILPPSVFLLYLYQRNAAYLSIWHTLFVIAVFTFGAVVLQLLVSKLVKSSAAAALISDVLWILFFTVKVPYRLIEDFFLHDILVIYVSVISVIPIIVIALIVRNKNKLQKLEVFKIIAVFWIVFFMLNAVPAFIYALSSYSKYKGDAKNYKTEFNVDDNLPSPNIYWLLMDGMLGFKAMEHLFNDSQPEFTAQLTERGFIINRDAQFEALHSTNYCIPALMCPHYYDSFFVPELKNFDIVDYKKKLKLRGSLAEFRKSASLASARNELITAFNQRQEYQTSAIAMSASFLPPSCNNYYINKGKAKCDVEVLDIIEKFLLGEDILYRTTPLSRLYFIFRPLIKAYEKSKIESAAISEVSIEVSNSFFGKSYQGKYRWYLNALTDIMNYSGSKLVIVHDGNSHNPYIYDEHGSLIKRKEKEMLDPYNYPPQHHFTTTMVISYIDYILAVDPQAIIILQSDHGLHHEKTRQQLISKYGKTEEDVLLMQNQTISAVRIPEEYGGLEQPIEPPNITRLLINRYVGENYTMLAPEDIIK